MASDMVKLFINPGAGVQHLLPLFRELYAEGRAIPLVNGHGNAYFTAQSNVTLLLALMSKTIPHHNWMVEGQWRKGDADAATLLAKLTPGVLGEATDAEFHESIAELRNHPVTERTMDTARQMADEAIAELDAVPEGIVKEALIRFAHQVVKRSH